MMSKTLPEVLGVAPQPDDANPLILYHGRSCPDGFAAALAAWLFHGGRGEYRGLEHGEIGCAQDLGQTAGRTVYVLDFAFDARLLAQVAARAARLVLLDHHRSAAAKLQGFAAPRAVVHFDMEKSGAMLAWEFFQAGRPAPALVRHVQDRDLWRWELEDSAAFLAALDMEPRTFARWAEIAAFGPAQLQDFAARGAAMDEKFRQLCADMAEGAQPLVFDGVPGLMLNCPGVFHSQVGDLLARQSGTYALLWQAGKDGVVKVGLRSVPGFDCSALAERFGGGGHAQASGFRMGVEHLAALLAGRLQAGPGTPAA